MTYLRKHLKLITVAAACVAIGAAGSAIATAGAASTGTTTATRAAAGRIRRTPRPRAPAAPASARSSAAPSRRTWSWPPRRGFATVTIDRGFVQSVSGQQLTIREGTKKATYKTVTLTIPSNAKVRENRQASTLSALTAGQRVAVVQAPQRTWVIARSAPTP